MRNLSFILSFIFLHTLLNAATSTVSFELADIKKETQTIYVFKQLGDFFYKFDSVQIKGPKFKYEFNNNLDRGLYHFGLSKDKTVPIVLSTESFKVEGQLSDKNSLLFEGSVENDGYKKFIKHRNEFHKSMDEVGMEFAKFQKSSSNLPEEQQKEGLMKLREKFDALVADFNVYLVKHESIHIGQYVASAKTVYHPKSGDTYETLFSKEEFLNSDMYNGDFLTQKINFYYQRYVNQTPEAFIAAKDHILTLAENGSEGELAALISLTNLFINYSFKEYDNTIGLIKKNHGDKPIAKSYLNSISTKVMMEGFPVPNIILKDTAGIERSLSDLKGKVVLIDFWASWCGPCRMENPNVVRTYHKFKEKGFEVFSVSLDNSKSKWLTAIHQDKLQWTHVSDLKGWQSEVARLYGINAIPNTYLIDKNGYIIDKNLRGYRLEAKLNEIFNDKP